MGQRESDYFMLNAQYLDKKLTIFLEICSHALYIYCVEGVRGFLAKSFSSSFYDNFCDNDFFRENMNLTIFLMKKGPFFIKKNIYLILVR